MKLKGMRKACRLLCISWLCLWGVVPVYGQALRGTTGLLHAPSAEMQRDKTFMFGGNILDIIPLHYYDFDVKYTFNYYINITFFPWLEVGYTCTLNYANEGSTYFRKNRGENILIKTGLLTSVCECGKKVGGNLGLRRLYWGQMIRVHMIIMVEEEYQIVIRMVEIAFLPVII